MSSHVMGRICLQRLDKILNKILINQKTLFSPSPSICDGVVDCLSGEDEDPGVCQDKDHLLDDDQDHDYISKRKGRRVELEQFDIQKFEFLRLFTNYIF